MVLVSLLKLLQLNNLAESENAHFNNEHLVLHIGYDIFQSVRKVCGRFTDYAYINTRWDCY